MKMLYPKIEGNKIYDGKEHTIDPTKLNQIDGYELYLLDYYDEKYKRDCTTILEKSDEGFKKVSLLNYDLLLKMISNKELTLTKRDLSILGYAEDEIIIPSLEPKKDFKQYLYNYRYQQKELKILYIDEWFRIWETRGHENTPISREKFFYFQSKYTINWRNRRDDTPALSEQIEIATSKYYEHPNELESLKDYFYNDGNYYSNKTKKSR